MSVYDKELIIDGKAVRNPEQQVYKNMKDIEKLQETIKPEYKCTVELSTSTTSVAKSNTNAGTEVKSGWLLDPKGKKFKITGGDDDNLLIDFYTSYQGPQGEEGPSGSDDIDDSTIANNKVWSSNKVNTEVGKAKDKGIYFTTTQPTYDSGLYYLDEGYFDNVNSDIPIKAYDLLVYIDSDDKVKEIYKVLSKTGSNWSLDKIGDVGGKQLYKHNVLIYKDGGRYYDYLFIDNMITDSPTPMNYSDIIKYLGDNGYVYDSNKNVYRQNEYAMRGWSFDSNNSSYIWYVGVLKASNTEIKTHAMTGDGTIDISSGWTIVDKISTL